MMVPDLPCLRCEQIDRLVMQSYTTDFGGTIIVYICLRCGTAQIETIGDRPPDGLPDIPDIVIKSS